VRGLKAVPPVAAPVALVTAASKGMGAACARELAARGYRVSLLARSAGVEALARELGGGATRGSVESAADLERYEAIRAATPSARYGRAEEIAKTVAFLLSADAGYVTGQSIRTDRGIMRSV